MDWKRIDEICDVITGGEAPIDCMRINEPIGDYRYPIWANGVEVYGYTKTYQVEKDAVCISSIGANTGAVFFRKGNFTPIIRLKVLIPKSNEINTKYLYYAMSRVKFSIKKSSVPNMSANDIKKQIVPIPPIEIQNKIVSILDKFEAVVEDIVNGIPSEIQARQKQYEYYRDRLFDFKVA